MRACSRRTGSRRGCGARSVPPRPRRSAGAPGSAAASGAARPISGSGPGASGSPPARSAAPAIGSSPGTTAPAVPRPRSWIWSPGRGRPSRSSRSRPAAAVSAARWSAWTKRSAGACGGPPPGCGPWSRGAGASRRDRVSGWMWSKCGFRRRRLPPTAFPVGRPARGVRSPRGAPAAVSSGGSSARRRGAGAVGFGPRSNGRWCGSGAASSERREFGSARGAAPIMAGSARAGLTQW